MYNDIVNINVYIREIYRFTVILTKNTKKIMFPNEAVVFKSLKIAGTQKVYANDTE